METFVVIAYTAPGTYPVEGILDVIVAPEPDPALWHWVQFTPSVGDPVFPPGEPVLVEVEDFG